MWISAFFNNSGTPTTGLSAIITIYKVSDSSKVVNSTAMTEVAEGFYKYNFTTRDNTEAYTYICDSVALAGTERYAIGDIEANKFDTIDVIVGLVHQNIYIDSTTYDNYGNLTSARLRIYSSSASVGTDNNVLATYTITASAGAASGRFTTWTQVKV